MFFNTKLCEAITRRDKELWLKMMNIMNLVGNNSLSGMAERSDLYVNCHSICRALAILVPELTVIDGDFIGVKPTVIQGRTEYLIMRGEHSWLTTPDDAIIDPYPMGCIATTPIIMGPKGPYVVYGKELYVPNVETTRTAIGRKVWRQTHVLVRIIKNIQTKMST